MKFNYQCINGVPPADLMEQILTLHFQIFDGQSREELTREINEAPQLFTVFALSDTQLVGYKMGYRRKEGHFYSWLGCVNEAFRGQKIGSQLMQMQHEWCKENGCHTIRTMTLNRWRKMLILNLQHGFNVVGILADNPNEPKIILEKHL